MRGFLVGSFALIVLQVVLSSQGSPGAIKTAGQLVATTVERFVSPDVPAIGPRPAGTPAHAGNAIPQQRPDFSITTPKDAFS